MGDTNPLTGVSGPGKFAVREDLPPSQNYGDRKVMQEDIAGASTRPQPIAKPEPMIGLFAPTQRKDEPADDSEFKMNIEASKSVLAYIADLPNTSPETRAAIKELWNM